MRCGVLFIAVLIAFLCGMLAARTRRVRAQVGIAVGVIAVLGAAVLAHAFLGRWTVTATLLLGAAAVAVLVWGLVQDKQAAASPPRSRRVRVGRVVAAVYAALAVLALLVVGAAVGVKGRTADVPMIGSVQPLPKSLAIADTSDDGCDSGSHTVCRREVDIVPVDGGDADATTVRTVLDSLAKHHGWHLTQAAAADDWTGCHTVGHLFDRVEECVEVSVHDSQAVVVIEQSDSW